MRKTLAVLSVAVLPLLLVSCAQEGERPQKTSLDTPSEELSYALGLEIGSTLGNTPFDVDLNAFEQGVTDAFEGREPLLTPEEAAQIKAEFSERLMQEGGEVYGAIAQQNLEQGQAFLEENARREGVVTTASGLQYTVLVEGSGRKPGPQDAVSVNYVGTLIDGTEFDSSFRRGRPARFRVDGVIPGWTEALQLMSVGSKYRVFIPPNLAYGLRGVGPDIGPNATLIFEMELVAIE
jgi:FKBP-type peptidyl-prolyl cis-trans isomerase